MILGIDASNIRGGGGVTHLVELLRAANPLDSGFGSVILWGGKSTLDIVEPRPWLSKIHVNQLDRGLFFRVLWQTFSLTRLARDAMCDVLFLPGSTDASGFEPIVTMSQNLLPFDLSELLRFGWSSKTLRLLLLRWVQSRLFRKAEGIVFLSSYARDAVLAVTGTLQSDFAIISHGISPRFRQYPRHQRLMNEIDENNPISVLYVSIVDLYKHQWHVAEAVAQLKSEGIPIKLDLIGAPSTGTKRLQETLRRIDPDGSFITYFGGVSYDQLHIHYAAADIGVFASSCETFGMILTEAMSAGLPIACANRSAMPEILGDAGIYFDPEKPSDIARALRQLIRSPDLRTQLAQSAFARAQGFTWERCADETFSFLAQIAIRHRTSACAAS